MKHKNENDTDQPIPENHDLLQPGRSNLRPDCENCFAFCCVALFFSASEGFPTDKDAGEPCLNLQPDFHCAVHKELGEQGLKGCQAFDCLGAGQKVAQISFGGHDWLKYPELGTQMFKVFLIMRQLHEFLWYLDEAITWPAAFSIHSELKSMKGETELLTMLNPDSLLKLDVQRHQAYVNTLLLKTSELVREEARRSQGARSKQIRKLRPGADLIGSDLRKLDLRGVNLRSAYLIAADLRGCDLSWSDLIGVDFRDADLRGADLARSIFLSQAQLNSARGDRFTKIPTILNRPSHWNV